jgi:hypothetical protein
MKNPSEIARDFVKGWHNGAGGLPSLWPFCGIWTL